MPTMDNFNVFFLSFAIVSVLTSSLASSSNLKKKGYLKPERLDHKTVSGRWYLYMDTRTSDVRDNTYGDFDVLSNGRLVTTLYRWFPDLEECRTTALYFDPIGSDPETAVKFQVTRKSTNEQLGIQTLLYINDHPTEGFVIMHQQTRLETYLVTTRKRDPSNIDGDIETALLDLNLDPQNFRTKSTDYGCEKKSERGIEL